MRHLAIEPNYYTIQLRTGEEAKLTLTFDKLYRLKSKDKALYEDYMKIMNGQGEDGEIDTIRVLYAAYVCSNLENEEYYSFEEFLRVVPYDRDIIGLAMEMLLTPSKKKETLRNLSGKQQENVKDE